MATSRVSLNGRVAAITGAARGIGKATADAFIRSGMTVAIGDLDSELAERTAAELGHGTIALPLDVTDRASVATFLDSTEQKLGRLDILVNNAGIMLVGAPLWEEDDLRARRQIDINIVGVLNGIKEAVPRLRASGGGHIVNIASGAGKIGFAGGATYCGTKHFVIGASEALRAELRGTGIEVSCVMPAIVNTELASGGHSVRGLRSVEPEDVAVAIVRALEHPRFEIHVPAELGALSRAHALVPRRAFEALLRATRAASVLSDLDHDARAAYEHRASGADADTAQPARETSASRAPLVEDHQEPEMSKAAER
jgi:NADP-dependent 3-hydroxy acid dehydrogenase YdfG